MNERIKELAERSGYTKERWNTTEEFENFLENFAKLVAQDCANICMEMAAKCAGLPGDEALAKDCAYWIKQDFGVE